MGNSPETRTVTRDGLRAAIASYFATTSHLMDAGKLADWLFDHADASHGGRRVNRMEDVRVGDLIVLTNGNVYECSGFDDDPCHGHRLYASLVTTHTEQDFPVYRDMFDHALRRGEVTA